MDSKKINKRDFKKGINLEDSRRRREESSIRLRKDSKCEGIAKRRNLTKVAETVSENDQGLYNDNMLGNLLLGLRSMEDQQQTNSLRSIRRLLSVEKNPPVKQCIEAGLVPILVNFLSKMNFEQQFEAAWALTNIASTDQTRVVVDSHAIPPLVALLMSENADIREQSAWCLGNIAGDGADLRDFILSSGALEPLLLNISQPSSISVLRNCVWTLSNFCRGKPQPMISKVAPALPVLANLLISEVDVEVMTDAAWALSYISDGDDVRIQKVVELGILPSLVKMISSGVTNMIIPALRTLGNIVSGNDSQTQAVIDANTLPSLCLLLQNAKKSIRKETCWVLSNIAAGTAQQMSSLFAVPDLIQRVVQQLNSMTEWDVRKEAAWVICNLITSSAETRIIEMIELGTISPLCELLNAGDSRVILIALDALEAILRVSNNLHSVTQLIEEAGGVDLLEKLQEHENTKVYQKTVQILERYFNVEEEQQEENYTPNITNNHFTFGNFKAGFGEQNALTYNANPTASFSF